MTGELFTQIIIGAITIMGALITAYVLPWLKTRISADELAQLQVYVNMAVRCANQIYTSEQWQEKKQYVMDYIRGIVAGKLSIELTEDQIDTIVEGVVNEVKKNDK